MRNELGVTHPNYEQPLTPPDSHHDGDHAEANFTKKRKAELVKRVNEWLKLEHTNPIAHFNVLDQLKGAQS